MKFTMYSADGDGAHLLYRMREEGNDVELYIKHPEYRRGWDGLLPKVDKFNPGKDDVIIFDFSGFGTIADGLRKSGHLVVGGSELADKLEQERMFGLDFMEASGIKIPLTVDFDKFNTKLVANFLEEYGGDGKRFVFKPNGKNLPSSLTYCSKDDEDLMQWVEYVDKYYGKDVESFVLQQFMEGVVVSTEIWSDGNKFAPGSLNHDVEIKAFMDHCLGQATGCSGNIVWAEHSTACRIAAEGLLRVEEAVIRGGHVGPMDLNVVANDEGIWGLEWTPRFGYEGITNLPLLIKGDVGEFFYNIASGRGDAVSMNDSFVSSVRLTIPPYPAEPKHLADTARVTPNVGIPIRGFPKDPAKMDLFHFYEVMDEGDGILRHSPGIGIIAAVMGVSDDPRGAFVEPYGILEELILPNKQYRTDLAEVLGKMYEQVVEQEGILAHI